MYKMKNSVGDLSKNPQRQLVVVDFCMMGAAEKTAKVTCNKAVASKSATRPVFLSHYFHPAPK